MTSLLFGSEAAQNILSRDKLNEFLTAAKEYFLHNPAYCDRCKELVHEPVFFGDEKYSGAFAVVCNCPPDSWNWVEIQDIESTVK